MGSVFGNILKVSTFGESHGAGIGAVVDGVPSGLEISEDLIQVELDRRRPGTSKFVSPRNEADKVEIISGVSMGKTLGTPIMLLIRNTNQRSKDYGDLLQKFRPSHADFTYYKKYGTPPQPGGGRSSGRETAARVAAGAIARLILGDAVTFESAVTQVGTVTAQSVDFPFADDNPLRFAAAENLALAENEVETARERGDSVGGVVELKVSNIPAGLGEPVFDKLDARIAGALFSIGGVKGVEIGAGFAAATMSGSEYNEPISENFIAGCHNYAGGILGGISNSHPLTARIAVKPTPSISLEQRSINIQGEVCSVEIKGRHDPCLCPRIAVVAEAMMALVVADALLEHKARY